jgi:hypothetical protein
MHLQKGGQKGGINQPQQYYEPYYQQEYYNQQPLQQQPLQQQPLQQQEYYNQPPLQQQEYYNQPPLLQQEYYQEENPIFVVREKKTKNESFLTYYVEVDLTLYPGKTIPLEDYSSLICQFKYEKIKESWAELFGYQYAPGIFSKPSDYGLKNKTITSTKSNSQNTMKKNKNTKYNTTRNNRNDNQ